MQNEMLLVLILEDDVLIQDMVREALSEGGFETQVVPSGEEAIRLLEADSTKHRALLTDINVRGSLTGWDVAKRARELNPAVPVII
ncbi:response regulator [Bradyrhizobium shewense]|uniref:response regulator n=1 Tax=Bradyrhizobium shewense TaxID=1761772 RepID=UPI003221CFFA